MTDSFANRADTVSAPATRAVAVTPHDANALSDVPKALYVGTGGNLTMRGVNGTSDQQPQRQGLPPMTDYRLDNRPTGRIEHGGALLLAAARRGCFR